VVRSALLKLKYSYAREIAKDLVFYSKPLLESKAFILPKNSLFVPIPLYFLKENLRGFNQTKILGEALAEKYGWKFMPDLLLRKKLRRPQARLKGKERKENVKGVFAFNTRYRLVSDSCIIFDDVYTTGSTLREACKVLKKFGAGNVWGLTIAR